MLRAVLLALFVLFSSPVAADDDDAGTLNSPGLHKEDDDEDEPADEPTDEDIDQYWQEDEEDAEELLDLRDDASADRMEGIAADAEREAEDEGEPKDDLTHPDDDADADDPYAESAKEADDPFASLMKDPYGTDEPDDDDAPVRVPDADVVPKLGVPDILSTEKPSTPEVLGRPLDEDDAADGGP